MKYDAFNDRPHEVHRIALDLVPASSRVLELGCATGYFSERLRRKQCRVTGVELDAAAAALARRHADAVIVGSLEDPAVLALPRAAFDVVLLLDVLEHVQNAARLLDFARDRLAPGGRLVLSTPNVAHLSVRLRLLLGRFDYTPTGILDDGHVRFYTRRSLLELLQRSGFEIERLVASSDLGQIPVTGRLLHRVPKSWQAGATRLWPALLAPQWVVVATAARPALSTAPPSC